MKKLLSVLLAAVLLITAMPLGEFSFTARAATEYTNGYFTYEVSNDRATIARVDTSISGDITIPSTLGGYPVTSIGDAAFERCYNLISITIPSSVRSMGDYAFSHCESLTDITIPDSVTSISDYAFYNCISLTSITIPNGVTSIGVSAFYYCDNLTSVTIPDSVTSIGYRAFENCISLTSITIPDSVTSIGDSAFYNCTSLTNITIPDSITSIGYYLFGKCESLTSITIPDSVRSIGNRAFCYCTSLTSIAIPDSVTNIGASAFYKCRNLTSITIPDSVTSIGGWVFYKCTSLTSITIPDNVTSIGKCAFSGCTSLIDITLPDSTTSIGDEAFFDCSSLTSITIPDSITNIGDVAFCYCNGLSDVYYSGSEAQRARIIIGENNEPLTNAAWHYNSNVCTHKYTNTCDTTCDLCGATRTVTHNFAKRTVVKATTSRNGYILTECSLCGKDKSKSTIYYPKNISLSGVNYAYSGKVITPKVVVKNSAGQTIASKYYTVTYARGRKNVGRYAVTIKFKGNYSGSKTLYFNILPPKTTVSKLTAGKKSFTATITKKSAQVTGYQLQYSTNKKFSGAKTKTIRSYKTTKQTIKNLYAKKYYYVRVRTYKTVGGKNYYSGWSNYKYIKTK